VQNEIILITSIFPPQSGGPAVFTSRYSKWLLENGLNNKVISYSRVSKKNGNVNLVRLRPLRLYSFLRFVLTIIVKSNKQSLILANGAFLETFIACKILRRSYVVKIPGDPVWEFTRNRRWTELSREDFQNHKLSLIPTILRFFYSSCFKSAKYVICPSQELVDFSKKWGISNDRIKLIYNCVDPRKFSVEASPQKKYDLISVSRLVLGKGFEELLEVTLKLNLDLAIIGDGPLLRSLKILSESNHIKVDFLGNIPNDSLKPILNSAKIFVLNSESEATSYALIEAKMCGLPIIAKNNLGSATVVRHLIDGLLYPVGSISNLETAINHLTLDESLMLDYGIKGSEDALIRFDQDLNFSKILDTLRL
jgi:glycosyltransferase involved in cell wall biosynthesis